MLNLEKLRRGYDQAAKALLDEAATDGTWVGELSSSPLSTATAIAALELARRDRPELAKDFDGLIHRGLQWLVEHQNADGGWGDTILSHSNISTTTLCYASLHLVGSKGEEGGASGTRPTLQDAAGRAKVYMDQHGGFDAIKRRYGKDHTFSVPILTQCALAGLIPWRDISPLPFELGWLPHWFFRWIRLPVVSYALPALIAIGQVRHHMAPSWNPLHRFLRQLAVEPTLRRLTSIQPESGGFLEATPLTSFVTMSLAAMGKTDHPVARQGIKFLQDSVRPDGSWPIDTNLATWVTTLSVNALLSESLPDATKDSITAWLLAQQHKIVHRYTNADPGGWAWTDLSGGVPDADDTPGAILALLKLNSGNLKSPAESASGIEGGIGRSMGFSPCPELPMALASGIEWLLNLQNNDGGWPTFCRGWGALPFDRSTPDLTAHALRALRAWKSAQHSPSTGPKHSESHFIRRIDEAATRGFRFLERTQRTDGTWLPLWFGNQFAHDDENPVYGVSRALLAYRDWNRLGEPVPQRAIAWLASVQNADGGWGGAANTPSSTEETALAVEALLPVKAFEEGCHRGLDWLIGKVETEKFRNPAPIGLYFAKLWYFEQLYPIIFTVSALARAVEQTSHPAKGQ